MPVNKTILAFILAVILLVFELKGQPIKMSELYWKAILTALFGYTKTKLNCNKNLNYNVKISK